MSPSAPLVNIEIEQLLISTSLVDHVAAKNVFPSMKHGASTSQYVTGMTKPLENTAILCAGEMQEGGSLAAGGRKPVSVGFLSIRRSCNGEDEELFADRNCILRTVQGE